FALQTGRCPFAGFSGSGARLANGLCLLGGTGFAKALLWHLLCKPAAALSLVFQALERAPQTGSVCLAASALPKRCFGICSANRPLPFR
ncbi:hypothetical protein LJB68_09745, partial [bacterium 210820-DFI.6.52]|nr:hypothetical protein [bacterium 210820-DFI.6.52]